MGFDFFEDDAGPLSVGPEIRIKRELLFFL